jgi:hypothetical protein
MLEPPRLLTDGEVDEIRTGLRAGLAGPVVRKWVAQLLADHDERVRLENERKWGKPPKA